MKVRKEQCSGLGAPSFLLESFCHKVFVQSIISCARASHLCGLREAQLQVHQDLVSDVATCELFFAL